MTELVETQCVVTGAGVIGLAIARELALTGREVVILEAEGAIGLGNSSRNSEVIHAGIYYPPGSLKAQLCVEGRDLLYRYCQERQIEHRRLGKLIVAADAGQAAMLEGLVTRARANGVHDLQRLSGGEVRQLEPELVAHSAALSPATGILDSGGLMLALRADAEAAGAIVALGARVQGGRILEDGRTSLDVGGTSPMQVVARQIVNSAGLEAQRVALSIAGFPPASVPPLRLAKGNYFALTGKSPFRRLVYPVPEPGGLGIHLTLDLGSRARFGPDIEWVSEIDFSVDPRRAAAFERAIRRYWPGLPSGALAPAYAGIRPKLGGPGDPPSDFVINGPDTHGVPGHVHLFAMESPGLTSSLAVARLVGKMLAR